MPIEFRCTSCQKLLRTPDESAGKKAKCPQCSAIVDVPLASMPPMPPPEFPSGPSDLGTGVNSNPFSEGTGSAPVKNFAPPAAAGSENPYATFSAPTSMPGAAWSSLSRGEPVHTLVTFDEVFRGTWEFFSKRIGPFALLGGITIGISIALNIVSSILNVVAQKVGDPELYIAVTAVFSILGAAIQIMLSAGQVLYVLRLVRTGEAKVNELWAGIRYTFTVLGLGIVILLFLLGILTIFALPVAAVALAMGPQNIDRNPLPVVVTGIVMGLALVVLWCWVSIRLILVYCFMVDRDRGIFGSISDSWKYTSGNAMTAFLVYVVVGFLSFLFVIVTCCIGQVLSQPYITLTTVMFYLYATGQMRNQSPLGSVAEFR